MFQFLFYIHLTKDLEEKDLKRQIELFNFKILFGFLFETKPGCFINLLFI